MRSWGGLPAKSQSETVVSWASEVKPALARPGRVQAGLACGNGRSYGDCGLAANGRQLVTLRLDKFLDFDPEQGVLSCEAGVTLDDILSFCVPRGWMLPVLPGTRYVTVGGAIANDIHGKNHHRQGSFGRHVRSLELQRSQGELLHCSPTENADWFAATIAGLGLTGVVMAAQLQLQRITGSELQTETIKFAHLRDFFSLAAESDEHFEYTVSWVDCLARGEQLGRGHFIRANPVAGKLVYPKGGSKLAVPVQLPVSLINRYTLRAFNAAYYHRQRTPSKESTQAMQSFFFPLDGIRNWNRIYGRAGFRQFQCVVPKAESESAIAELLERVAMVGDGSFLVVLKTFGALLSPGLLSFPREGTTLALDIPWRGERSEQLLKALEQTVVSAGGAIYPAKDAHMSRESFRRAYPGWSAFAPFRDRAIASLMSQRLLDE
ncbi:MAG: FAD/FMN-containing dehydrogenase [Halieaceae bacterium]|jgi:FAD/FMN-containing dehydrogenase